MRTDEASWHAPGSGAAVDAPADLAEGAPGADLAAEVRALRARLRTVETALGTPAPPGHRAPPSLPDVTRRLAVLERRAGVVPGLVPLPGLGAASARGTAVPATASRAQQAWREWGQAALAAILLVALVAWLVRPVGSGDRAAEHPTGGPTVTAAQATLAPRAVPAAPGARSVGLSCLLGGNASCAVEGAPVPPGVWGRDESCDGPAARVCGDAGGVSTPARVP